MKLGNSQDSIAFKKIIYPFVRDLGAKKVGGGIASIWLGRNKRRKLAVSRRFNFSELISLDQVAGRWWKSTGRREVDKERPNGMNGIVGGGHRPRKWDLQARTRERESKWNFHLGAVVRLRCSCCSRVCIVFTLPLPSPGPRSSRVSLYFSTPSVVVLLVHFHRAFLFSSTSTTFRPCLLDWLHFRGQILRDWGETED